MYRRYLTYRTCSVYLSQWITAEVWAKFCATCKYSNISCSCNHRNNKKKKSYVNLEYMSDKVKYLRFICYLLFYVRRLGEAGQWAWTNNNNKKKQSSEHLKHCDTNTSAERREHRLTIKHGFMMFGQRSNETSVCAPEICRGYSGGVTG